MHGVRQLADIRSIPKSRRHPHFAGEALAVSQPHDVVRPAFASDIRRAVG
jgi:hypothetical protein